ncbi:L-myo-inositol 1 phosphate synthase putative [Entamoeba histolytica]|uniref:Inositol-3-phosphate synthase n=1 Tax=Entamoeba histolytica TaxID=5759 RepID=A0A175JP89_ENTHI|nr:L-myo-inositol 1 phosphate synthase putative [Entamoeba histolytica]
MSYQFHSTKSHQTESSIEADFHYETTHVEVSKEGVICTPIAKDYKFKVDKKIPKMGLMMIGWGGNNGTTVTAGILANKHHLCWTDRRGVHEPNYYGSYTQSATMRLGATSEGEEIYAPYKDILPFVCPDNIVVGGWDISKVNMADALKRAQVVDYDLQRQLYPYMKELVPLPSIYYKSYIAANQDDRADNVIPGTKQNHLDTVRQNIRDFKAQHGLDKIVVLWTATTERYVEIKEQSIVSYNHLGNNDGKNLSSPSQFRSKEISKSNVVSDVVKSNNIMYKEGEHPDHVIVIKYVPYVGDSKRAMDEYTSEIFLGGHNTIALHNTCEDSLLAAPLMIDLAVLMEFMTRVTYSIDGKEFKNFNSVMSMISYLLKAPVVPKGSPVINALFKQRECLDNFFRALLGLPCDNHLLLEGKTEHFF